MLNRKTNETSSGVQRINALILSKIFNGENEKILRKVILHSIKH